MESFVPHWANEVALIVAGLLLAGGALMINYLERRSHHELARHYERMLAVFEKGLSESGRHWRERNFASLQETLQALGEESVFEHSQWLVLRRNRPIDVMIH